ncbi:hypothetical protein GCM10023333_10560 [Ferrimonas pelagia]|uniref:Uncharacterized protein n=1 Tax=Ferrimonas pelagia TaxID=1177826 RepID=A0ABP9EHV1_9GAMM
MADRELGGALFESGWPLLLWEKGDSKRVGCGRTVTKLRHAKIRATRLCPADFEERSDEGRQTGLLGDEVPALSIDQAVASATRGL